MVHGCFLLHLLNRHRLLHHLLTVLTSLTVLSRVSIVFVQSLVKSLFSLMFRIPCALVNVRMFVCSVKHRRQPCIKLLQIV